MSTTPSAGLETIRFSAPGSTSLTQIGGATITLGQKPMATSLPVALASDQPALSVAQSGAWSVTVSGSVAVSNFPATQPVSGSVSVSNLPATQAISAASLPLPTGAATLAKQPALGTAGTAAADVISVQGIAAMTALKVDGSGVTQPISATSLPLPTLAATSTKQPALGTAGNAAADVISVQGVASMTALKVDGSGVTQPVSGSLTAVASITNPVAVTGTFYQVTQPISGSVSVSGNVEITNDVGNPLPVNGTVTANQGSPPWTEDITKFGGTAVSTGTGTGGAGIPRVTVSSDSSLAANQSVNVNQVGGSAISEGQKAMTASLPVVIASDQSAVPVSGTFYQATQPVSGAFYQTTQPVSLTQVAGAAISATNPIPVQITDGRSVSDLAGMLQALLRLQVQALDVALCPPQMGGFLPIEIPSFLGA